jgi:ATP-binding cassette subfamily B (MDR/TAP) protein 1
VAEEALNNVKTVMAFGGYDKEIQRYEDGLAVANVAAKKRGAISSFGIGLMWLIIWCSYALAFWYGTKLILEGRDSICNGEDAEYTAEELLVVRGKYYSAIGSRKVEWK